MTSAAGFMAELVGVFHTEQRTAQPSCSELAA